MPIPEFIQDALNLANFGQLPDETPQQPQTQQAPNLDWAQQLVSGLATPPPPAPVAQAPTPVVEAPANTSPAPVQPTEVFSPERAAAAVTSAATTQASPADEAFSAGLNAQLAGAPTPGSAKTSKKALANQGTLGNIAVASQAEAARQTQGAQEAVQKAESEGYKQIMAGEDQALKDAELGRQKAVGRAQIELQKADSRVQDLSNKEPNPGRLWANASNFTKATMLLSTLAYSLSSARLNPTAINPMLVQFRELIKQDVGFQEETNRKNLALEQTRRGDILQEKTDALSAADRSYRDSQVRLQSLDRYLQSLAKSAGSDQRRLAGIAATRQSLATMQMTLQKEHGSFLQQKEMKAADYAHAERMAQTAWDRQQAAANAKANKPNEDMWPLSPQLGISVVRKAPKVDAQGRPILDQNGQPIIETAALPQDQAFVHKEMHNKASAIGARANVLYDALERVENAMAAQPDKNWEQIAHRNPELNQDIQLVARYMATEKTFNDGPTANQDVAQAVSISAGRLEAGVAEKLATLTQRGDMALAAIRHYKGNLPDVVNQSLQTYTPPAAGQYFQWQPPQAKSVAPDDSPYQVPGEKEQRIRKSLDIEAGIPTKETIPNPAFPPGTQSFGAPAEVQNPRYIPATNLPPMSGEQIRAANKLDGEIQGMTTRAVREIAAARLPDAAARRRYFQAKSADLDKVEEKEREVAENLVAEKLKLEYVDDPDRPGRAVPKQVMDDVTNKDIREMMAAAKFEPAKLAPEDYEYIRSLVDAEVARRNKLK